MIATIMIIGTVGVHFIEKMPYLDAFYFMSMIATGQGPFYTPGTALGKIFVAIMAFLSVGIGVAALGFLFGPFMGELWHIGRIKFEEKTSARNPK
jgi:hypothetical protein